MKIVRNLKEHVSGLIDCEILIGDEWHPHSMESSDEYELHESSEWPDIKPCPQDEKDAHKQQLERDQFKQERTQAVQNLTVTTSSGNTFDADETSQTRMARALSVLDDGEYTLWVLADNTPIQASREELKEALRLAGEAQSNLWVKA